jgi:hypothetical protein
MAEDALSPVPGEAPEPPTEAKKGRRVRLELSGPVIFAIATALLLNVVGLIVVVVTSSGTRREMEGRIRELSAQIARTRPTPTSVDGDHATRLLDISNRLHEMGEVESARRLRAAAQRLLMDKEGEMGAFRLAVDLLEEGRTREARRAFYRILACGDQPGTGWGALALRSRFLIGVTLSEEADRIEAEREGDT